MFKTIVRKELLENILSYRFPLFFLITAVLILVSIYVYNVDYHKQRPRSTASRSGWPRKSWPPPGCRI